MSIDKTYLEHKTKKRRPLGIWVLTIYAILYIVIYRQLPVAIESLGYTAMYSESAMRVNYVYGFLEIFVIIASILAWSGWEIGRKSFLFFVILYFLGDGIYYFEWGTRILDLDDFNNWIGYITDFGFPLLCIWYFNRPSTKDIFQER